MVPPEESISNENEQLLCETKFCLSNNIALFHSGKRFAVTISNDKINEEEKYQDYTPPSFGGMGNFN